MTPLNDDLLTALQAARPDPGYQPSATSPEATAMLARILTPDPEPAPRAIRRRLLLTGIPVVAGTAATVLAVAATSSGPASTRPTVSTVRTAMLDAFEQDSGDIVYSARTIQAAKGKLITQQAWAYPAFPVPGQLVRFRLFHFLNGIPQSDTESIYVANAASSQLTQSTAQGPSSAQIIDVEYGTRTWSRQQSSSVLLAGNLSPTLIRDQIASGGFTVVGTVRLHGREAVKLTWSRKTGMLTMKTTLWVDAGTYQPMRSVTTTQGPNGTPLETDTTQLQVLPATPANLKLLSPPIPPGFTRTAKSPHF